MPTRLAKLILLVAAGASAWSGFAADPLPLERTPAGRGTWYGLVGVPGGIPTNRTVFTNFSAGASTSAIQNALNICPSNQIVQLGAGTYNLGALTITRNGVTLRGAGMTNTIIANQTGSIAIMIGSDAWFTEWQSPNASLHRSWTAGYTQGTNVITVTNTTGMVVGQMILMDQFNDGDTTGYSPSNPDGDYSQEYTSVTYPGIARDRTQSQFNRVAAINGTQVTLYEPVYMPNWNATNSPQIWWFSAYSTSTPYCMTGIEDLKLTTGHNDVEAIDMRMTYACWVKNVWISGGGSHDSYVFTLLGLRTEVRHCRFDPEGNQSIDDYAFRTRAASGCLFEDNIGNGCGTLMMVNGVSGSVYAYNYATNLQSQGGFMTAGLFTHGATPNMCLFEGNFCPMFDMNSQWQNASYNVGHRNRFSGKDDGGLGVNGNIQAVEINATNRHISLIGNVLGTTGTHTWYQDDGTGACHDGSRVYYLGLEDSGGSCLGSIYDPLTVSTLIRAVNWTSATSTNSGVNLDGYTVGDLQNSYYLSNKPSFFGNLTWPPITPTNASYSISRTNIPAGYRLAFNAEPPPENNPPAPPALVELRCCGK